MGISIRLVSPPLQNHASVVICRRESGWCQKRQGGPQVRVDMHRAFIALDVRGCISKGRRQVRDSATGACFVNMCSCVRHHWQTRIAMQSFGTIASGPGNRSNSLGQAPKALINKACRMKLLCSEKAVSPTKCLLQHSDGSVGQAASMLEAGGVGVELGRGGRPRHDTKGRLTQPGSAKSRWLSLSMCEC
jgi:hypothetical protein